MSFLSSESVTSIPKKYIPSTYFHSHNRYLSPVLHRPPNEPRVLLFQNDSSICSNVANHLSDCGSCGGGVWGSVCVAHRIHPIDTIGNLLGIWSSQISSHLPTNGHNLQPSYPNLDQFGTSLHRLTSEQYQPSQFSRTHHKQTYHLASIGIAQHTDTTVCVHSHSRKPSQTNAVHTGRAAGIVVSITQ